jgi:hypothetical protein
MKYDLKLGITAIAQAIAILALSGCGGSEVNPADDRALIESDAIRQASRTDRTIPNIAISSEGWTTEGQLAYISGQAKDNVAVYAVKWVNDRGGSGNAVVSGKTRFAFWTAENIALQPGDNVITITVLDRAGNTATIAKTLVGVSDAVAQLPTAPAPAVPAQPGATPAPAPGSVVPAVKPGVPAAPTTGTPAVVPTTPVVAAAPAPAVPQGPMTIAGLGSPRILISDAATLARLRTALNNKTASSARFKSMVDRQMDGTGNAWNFQPWNAALMAQITGNAAYCTFAVSLTEKHVVAEEAAINAGGSASVAGDSYLDIGPIVGSMAIVYDWCRPQMSAAQRTRWANYGNQAVWNVWNHTQAKWGNKTFQWTGWSVDNPSNNYYYSFLRATMLLGLATYGENNQAQAWLDKFKKEKIDGQLVPTFNRDLQGGGSREGTGYGVAMKGLFDLYYWWEKSTGQRIADNTQHTLASFDKFIHDIVPTLDRVSPTGDHARDSTATLFDYHREYLEVLSRLYAGDAVAGVSKSLLEKSSVTEMSTSFEYWIDYLYDQTDIAAQPLTRLSTAHWGSGTGQFSTRSAWTTDATYANFICGPYTESHAHHDQGSFVLFKGNWLAFDANINSHSGLVQEEAPHNLVRVEQNGRVVPQTYETNCSMKALADNAVYSYGLANVTPVYQGQAAVAKMEREFLFIKPGTLVIFDRVQTAGAGVKRVWSLNLPVTPTISGDSLSATNGKSKLDMVRLAPTGLSSQVVSWPSANADISVGSRVDVADSNGNASLFLNVLGTDGAFSTAVRSDGTDQTGAQITLANGNTALVRFSSSGVGGTLEIRTPAGQVISSGALPTGVQAIARLAN